jgi:hypothetical protein
MNKNNNNSAIHQLLLLEQRKKREEDERLPPRINNSPSFDVCLRFQKTNASSSTIATRDLLGLYIIALTATTGVPVFEAFKIKSIRLYLPQVVHTTATGFAPGSIALQVLSTAVLGVSSEQTYSDQSSGSKGAYVKFKPKGLMRDWIDDQNDLNMFRAYGPIGTLVDVHLVYRKSSLASTPPIYTSTGATAGRTYWNYLDSKSTQYLQSTAPNNNSLVWVTP